MQVENVNLYAVLAAAVSNFLIGGLWYSPALFRHAWMRENGFSEEDLRRGNPAVILGLSFLFSLLMAGKAPGADGAGRSRCASRRQAGGPKSHSRRIRSTTRQE